MDDEWRARLADQLLGTARIPEADRATFAPDPSASMEIAFGKARTEMTYVLELGRTHQLPMTGNVMGDDVWLRIGDAELRFAFDRARGAVRARVNGRETTLSWDARQRAIATSEGKLVDMDFFVREAIDATVNAYQSSESGQSSQSK